jgi:hypothetical protein
MRERRSIEKTPGVDKTVDSCTAPLHAALTVSMLIVEKRGSLAIGGYPVKTALTSQVFRLLSGMKMPG